MRSVSGTLETAQTAASRTPYIHMVFTNYDSSDTEDLSTDSASYGNRILLIDHIEEAYNDYATVILRNYDRKLPTDLTGYWTDIGYGDTTGGGDEYSETSRLWVKYHQEISVAGNVLTVLRLDGKWKKLEETLLRLGKSPRYTAKNVDPGEDDFDFEDKTVYGIIEYLLENQTDPAMALDALAEDDGIINSLVPQLYVNFSNPFDDMAYVVSVLVRMTKSYLKAKAGLAWEVKYPQTTDSINFNFYSYQSPYFYEYADAKALVVPNRVYVFANAGEDGLWTNIITAQADDTTSQGRYGVVPTIALAPEVDNQSDADDRAASILVRTAAELPGGRLIVPHDCRMELYDVMSIVDQRGT